MHDPAADPGPRRPSADPGGGAPVVRSLDTAIRRLRAAVIIARLLAAGLVGRVLGSDTAHRLLASDAAVRWLDRLATAVDRLRRGVAVLEPPVRAALARAVTSPPAVRFRRRVERRELRIGLAAAVVCCLSLAAFAQTRTPTAGSTARTDAVAAQSELARTGGTAAAGSSAERAEHPQPADDPDTDGRDGSGASGDSARDDDHGSHDGRSHDGKRPDVDPGPVAGLSEVQMDNAKAIVRTGRDMDMPRRALVIAVATAMQESNLLNLASYAAPESLRHSHQGTGWDHDSVGLFQQRSSSGWGPVDRLMDPAFATAQFLNALSRVPGWQHMALTDAAQAVQVSAYPYLYAQHEWRATRVVDAIVPDWH